jgi:hypothetical protein
MSMLSLQTILLTSCLLIIAAMLASVAWLAVLRRAVAPARVETGSDRI